MSTLIDLTGEVYGRLLVIERAEDHILPSGQRRAKWRCRCDCGEVVVVAATHLRRGTTRSCGCLGREQSQRRLVMLHASGPFGSSRQEIVTYWAVHRRLRCDRGRASEQACVDCGGPAQQWSYDHACSDELTGVIRGQMMPYSLDPARYQPRCRSCHRRFDQARA